jgi:hypothetical protein
MQSSNTNFILGYHGTYLENFKSISEVGFKESLNHTKWYGDGAYFFVEGLKNPIEAASEFMIDTRLRDRGSACTDELCVLEALIEIIEDKYLDLTQSYGMQLFNMFRDEAIEKISQSGKKPSTTIADHHLFQVMREELEIEFVKGNVYIQFGILRSTNLTSKIPNVAIFVVNNPTKYVDKASINKVA